MKLVALIVCTILLVTSVSVVASYAANDFPSPPPTSQMATRAPAQPAGHPQLFSGYVPPPPIRHTWPGGYRVIFHEIMNTLAEHLLGQY